MVADDKLVQLAKLIEGHFDVAEMRTLCFDLRIDYEEISGQDSPKSLLARQIIAYMMRRGRLDDLINLIHVVRPDLGMSQLVGMTSLEDSLTPPRYSNERNLRIFLCHANEDKPLVRDLYSKLKSDGFQTWFDQESLVPGQDWELEIARALRDSDVVLVCSSQKSVNKTGFVQKELRNAIGIAQQQPEGAIFLIPIKLDDCELPEYLNRYQWVEYSSGEGYQHLIRALHAKAASLGIRPNSTFQYQNESSEAVESLLNRNRIPQIVLADRQTLSRVQELLPSTEVVPLLRDFDFGGTFFSEKLTPLYNFAYECELPEFGFLDEELEQLRVNLAATIVDLCRLLGQHTFPIPGRSNLSNISQELQYTHPALWTAVRDELNHEATQAYDAYVTLIKTARHKLIV